MRILQRGGRLMRIRTAEEWQHKDTALKEGDVPPHQPRGGKLKGHPLLTTKLRQIFACNTLPVR